MKVFVSIPRNSEVIRTFFPPMIKEYLEEKFQVSYSPLNRNLTMEEIPIYAKDAEVIITGWGHVPLNDGVLDQVPLKLIAHTGGSVGDLVSPKVYENGIRVISGNILYADSVAEGVLAYMLTALRRIPDYLLRVKQGGWSDENSYTEGLLEQTVGIIGMGTISLRLMKLLQLFHVQIKIFSHYPIEQEMLKKYCARQVPLEEIFSTCKIVSLHSSMNEKTKEMIRKQHFDLLQNDAVFINTARGGIIEENEMIEALKEKRFRAVLDVYQEEPLAYNSELRKLENVYCMPHQAGPTVDRRPRIAKCLIDNIVKFEKGEKMELEITKESASRMTVGG